jgi:hypothetical protein
MSGRAAVFCILMVLLAFLSGVARGQILGLRHLSSAEWVETTAFVVSLPLAKLAVLSPGLLTGYFFQGMRYLWVFAIACLAYIPYRYGAGAGPEHKLVALAANALAYAVAITVAFLAGRQLSRH